MFYYVSCIALSVFSLVSGFFDSGLVVVVAIILVLLTTVLSFLLLVTGNVMFEI